MPNLLPTPFFQASLQLELIVARQHNKTRNPVYSDSHGKLLHWWQASYLSSCHSYLFQERKRNGKDMINIESSVSGGQASGKQVASAQHTSFC
jgi:hypothetical protein